MSEARGRGRPLRRYAIRRIRLVNFHNFVDETIEVREGGHLFLLGDNGSGKTTVLDALHLALSGEHGVELNAAARIAGRRDEGRTLQGIVLRYDAERGVRNEGGAIAYAVVELFDPGEGAAFCVGLGMEATTMDARVNRWGVIHAGPLEELPLVAGAARAPASREQLRDALGKLQVLGHVSELRRAVADRLFGGEASYEEVCRFWQMAKAYREIVAGARDFATLFGRLLPAPDSEVFADILRSLVAIDELEATLGQIRAQRRYVGELVALAGEIGERREETARYRWLATHRRLEAERVRLEAIVAARAQAEAEVGRADAEVERAEGTLAATVEAVRTAETGDGHGLAERLRHARATEAERRGRMALARSDHERAARSEADAERGRLETIQRLVSAIEGRIAALDAGVRQVAEAPGDLRACRTLAAAERALAGAVRSGTMPAELDEPAAEAAIEAEAKVGATRAAVAEAERLAAAARADCVERRRVVAELAAQAEARPGVEGWSAAMAALADAGIAAHPVYTGLDPAAGAAPEALAAIEALAGEESLGAVMVLDAGGSALARAQAIVGAVAPAVRVVQRTANDAALPRWVAAALAPPGGTVGRTSHAVLAAALTQPSSLGEVVEGGAGGEIELRGLGFHASRRQPVLIGAESRARAHRERLEAARRALQAAEAAAEAGAARLRAAEARRAAALGLAAAVADVRGRAVFTAHASARAAAIASAHATQMAARTQNALDDAQGQHVDAARLLAALEARASERGLGAIERELATLRAAEAAARQRAGEAQQRRGALAAALAAHARDAAESAGRSEALRAELAGRAAELRALLAETHDDASLERWVRVTMRGDQFRSIEAIEERGRDAERAEAVAAAELAGDGSRGVRRLEYAGRFGFGYDRAGNHLADRRAQPAANVLAQLDRDIAEQEAVVNEKTRELMDRLVMGTLARHLQEQIERLRRTVRDINRLLEGLRFGGTTYQFKVTPRADRGELVELVRRLSLLDEASRREFRAWIDERLAELRQGLDAGGDVPEVLDYRRWFDYRLTMSSAANAGETELTREKRQLGSGGEQGVPNYLLVLALGSLMFENAKARLRPLFFDEAFYGIDAARRDQLLRLATELGLQIFVASPDQDGATDAVRAATTLFVVKDDAGDVHLAPHHYWNRTGDAQVGLFESSPEAPASEASCRTGELPRGSAETAG